MAHVAHFAINADDVKRARRFYERAFGWKFDPWGPPDFYMIDMGQENEPGIKGSLQARRELVPGHRLIGYECTIAVPSIDDATAAIEAHGGKIVLPKTVIAGVGSLIFFQDTEGNVAGAMQYDPNAK